MKKVLIISLLFISTLSFSQNSFQIEMNLGYPFQRNVFFDDQELEEPFALGTRFGVNYVKSIGDFYFEVGLFTSVIWAKRQVNALDYSSYNVSVQIPVYLGYQLSDSWKISSGIGVQNNKTFEDFNIQEDDNFRVDLLVKLVYLLNNKVHLSLFSNWLVSDSPDVYQIPNPRNGIYVGIIYSL